LSSGLLFALFLLFTLPGLAYGVTIGKIKNSNDFVEGMTEAMKTMGRYNVLSLFAAQLINYFDYTNMGTILATSGASSEEHTSELQSRFDLVGRLLVEKEKKEHQECE